MYFSFSFFDFLWDFSFPSLGLKYYKKMNILKLHPNKASRPLLLALLDILLFSIRRYWAVITQIFRTIASTQIKVNYLSLDFRFRFLYLMGAAPSGGVALGSSARGLVFPDECELPIVSEAILQASFSISHFFWVSTIVSEMLKQSWKFSAKEWTSSII